MLAPAVIAVLVCYAPAATWADYVLVLKNGRRITVQSYRETGSTIQVNGLGGEVGIAKDQVKAILKAPEADRADVNAAEPDRSPPAPSTRSLRDAGTRPAEPSVAPRTPQANDPVSPDEEASDHKRLAEIQQQLDAANRRYLTATQGGGAAAGATKEGYRALTADLMSRLKSRRGAADSEYEPQEKELRDLRAEIERLQSERDDLISRIKSKPAGTGLP
jgi:hypothetical protein